MADRHGKKMLFAFRNLAIWMIVSLEHSVDKHSTECAMNGNRDDLWASKFADYREIRWCTSDTPWYSDCNQRIGSERGIMMKNLKIIHDQFALEIGIV